MSVTLYMDVHYAKSGTSGLARPVSEYLNPGHPKAKSFAFLSSGAGELPISSENRAFPRAHQFWRARPAIPR
jgi:hypothetical protein